MRRLSLLAAVCSSALLSSCVAFDAAKDCLSICDRYKTCFDANYDSGACQSRCRDNASSDSNYFKQVDSCSACIDDKSCTSATFSCGVSCSNVVP